MSARIPLPGDTIDGRYRLGETIGRGQMGVVYSATDLETNAEVAVKCLLVTRGLKRAINRFFRGAQLSKKIEHPHIVRTLASGYYSDDAGSAYLVMERVYGLPLSQIMKTSLSAESFVSLMVQTLSALAHMHARGVLHRDLKPDNILVERLPDGSLLARITDFGLAAAMERDHEEELETGATTVLGTAAYMAPEQATGVGQISAVSDLYSIGVMLYEFLSGERPFDGTPLAIMIRKNSKDAPPLKAIHPLPDSLRDAVMRLLARTPAERFMTAADVTHAIQPSSSTPLLDEDVWLEAAGASVDLVLPPSGDQSRRSAPAQAEISLPFDDPTRNRPELLKTLETSMQRAEHGDGCALGLNSGLPLELRAVMDHVQFSIAESGRFTVLRGGFTNIAGALGGLRQALDTHWGLQGLSSEDIEVRVTAHLERHQANNAPELKNLLDFLLPNEALEAAEDRNQSARFATFFRVLRRLATEKPVCLLLDDLQSGGPMAAAFLEHALLEMTFDPLPLLLVTAAAATPDNPALRTISSQHASRDNHLFSQCVLKPEPTGALASLLARQTGLDRTLADRVARIANGSPQVARYLVDLCVQDAGDQTFEWVGGGSNTAPELEEVILSSVLPRLEAHPSGPALIRLLNCFAILGESVEYRLLSAMGHLALPDADFDTLLSVLIEMELIISAPGMHEERLSLWPAVLQSQLVRSLSPTERNEFHQLAIQAHLSSEGGHHGHASAAVGNHYAAMGRMHEAVQSWLQAMRQEYQAGDPLMGSEWAARVLNELPAEDPQAIACALQLGSTLLDSGHLERGIELLRPFIGQTTADGAMQVGEVLADLYENKGASTEWKRLIEQLDGVAHEGNDAGTRAYLRARAMWRNSYGMSNQGLADAVQALKHAPSGAESQRAAQRAVYCYLAMGRPAEGEPYARIALRESGNSASLRVRSLRALGTILTWTEKADEALTLHSQALNLCKANGLFARIPIVYHDLGDAYRMSGDGMGAEEAYAMALHYADELGMGHTLALVRVKQVMSALTDGRTEGVLEHLDVLAPEALASGLGLAIPFCALLRAWTHALLGEPALARKALKDAGNITSISVDPQVPSIVAAIHERIS